MVSTFAESLNGFNERGQDKAGIWYFFLTNLQKNEMSFTILLLN